MTFLLAHLGRGGVASMGTPWPDHVAAGTPIKADQVQGLRNAIDANVASARPHMDPWPWTWSSVDGQTPVMAKHFTEMKAAIQGLWDNKGRGPLPDWTSGVTPGGPSNGRAQTVIRATDITDLRRWLNQYEDNHPKNGVDSKSYDPSANNRPMVQILPASQDWIHDVRNLSLRLLFIRAEIRARRDTDPRFTTPLSHQDKEIYKSSFYNYWSQGMPVFVVLTNLWFWPSNLDIKGELTNFTNDYMDAFADAAKSLAADLMEVGVTDYVIWNEPNIPQGNNLTAQYFSALLWNTRQKLNELNPRPKMYWGGIFLQDRTIIPSEDSNYIEEVYDALVQAGKTSDHGPWPWDGINVHIHRVIPTARRHAVRGASHQEGHGGLFTALAHGIGIREQPFIDSVFNDLLRDKIRVQRNDPATRLVGEWGITQEDYDAGKRLTPTYTRIRAKADLMCFFSHHWHQESTGEWGTRKWSEQPPPSPDDGITPGKTLMVPPGDTTNLYDDLQDAYSTP